MRLLGAREEVNRLRDVLDGPAVLTVDTLGWYTVVSTRL